MEAEIEVMLILCICRNGDSLCKRCGFDCGCSGRGFLLNFELEFNFRCSKVSDQTVLGKRELTLSSSNANNTTLIAKIEIN